MTESDTKCMHGNKASLQKRPDLGPGWVERIAVDCRLCLADPEFCKAIPFKPGDWTPEKEAKEAAEAAGEAT